MSNPETRIPLTKLRRMYIALRHTLNAYDFHELLSSDYRKTAPLLARYFEQACTEFEDYSNQRESFHPDGKQRTQKTLAYKCKPESFAKCLQARLIIMEANPIVLTRSQSVEILQDLRFRYVDFEVSPYRTTGGARFLDGTSVKRSGGGLDLLLTSEAGLPVIGEIKAPTDVDMFIALVQSLTYASELSTANQIKRLRKFYHEANFREATQCDIILFYSKGDKPALLDETRQISQHFLTLLGTEVERRVRSIRFFETELLPWKEGTTQPDPMFSFRES
jgi:hypothetical protein